MASLPWRALLGRRAPLEQARFSRMYGLPTRHGLYMALVLLSLVALGLRVEEGGYTAPGYDVVMAASSGEGLFGAAAEGMGAPVELTE